MIELKQVSFTYQGQEHDGLRDINLTIADGECVPVSSNHLRAHETRGNLVCRLLL